MARRPKARLITGNFDLHDVSFRTEMRTPKPSPYKRQRVPPVGSPTREAILASRRLWQKDKLRPEAQKCLGHGVQLSRIMVKGRQRWKWSAKSIMCVGVSKSLEDARVTALEEVLHYLGSPHSYTAFVRLAKLVGHDFL